MFFIEAMFKGVYGLKINVRRKRKFKQCENGLCGKTACKVKRDKYLTVQLWLSNLGKLVGIKITY